MFRKIGTSTFWRKRTAGKIAHVSRVTHRAAQWCRLDRPVLRADKFQGNQLQFDRRYLRGQSFRRNPICEFVAASDTFYPAVHKQF
jgi:hypothetical protein